MRAGHKGSSGARTARVGCRIGTHVHTHTCTHTYTSKTTAVCKPMHLYVHQQMGDRVTHPEPQVP